jgi:hypothetical protein
VGNTRKTKGPPARDRCAASLDGSGSGRLSRSLSPAEAGSGNAEKAADLKSGGLRYPPRVEGQFCFDYGPDSLRCNCERSPSDNCGADIQTNVCATRRMGSSPLANKGGLIRHCTPAWFPWAPSGASRKCCAA